MKVLILILATVFTQVAYADSEIEGEKPFIPSRLEWLELKYQTICNRYRPAQDVVFFDLVVQIPPKEAKKANTLWVKTELVSTSQPIKDAKHIVHTVLMECVDDIRQEAKAMGGDWLTVVPVECVNANCGDK